MKKFLLMITIILCNYGNVHSQNTKLLQPYPIFESCINSENSSDCFDKTVINFIFTDSFKGEILSALIENNRSDGVITFAISLVINENGRPIDKSIDVSAKNLNSLKEKIHETILNLPKILPAKNIIQ